MSLLGEHPVAPAPPTPPAAPHSWWRRHRAGLAVGVALVAAVVVVVVTGGGDPAYDGPLDPADPGSGGARAVARVLAAQDVGVEVVRSADDFEAERVDEATTVVVTQADQLGASTVRRLREHAGGASIVVVDPGPLLLDELGLDGDVSGTDIDLPSGARITGVCLDPRFDDLAIEVDDARTMPATTGPTCFGGALSLGERLTVLGAPDLLSNGQVLRADNAAVALRLLGAEPQVLWYVADAADLAADDGVGLASLLPAAVVPGLVMLGVALAGLVVWRSRRLGPLAVEPLPVVVKAIETTRSRGRLYRRAGDRGHAADALRAAARDRARTRLRLGSADQASLVRAVAHQTGRAEAAVADLLSDAGRTPTSDRDLVVLATDLTRLDDEVRR